MNKRSLILLLLAAATTVMSSCSDSSNGSSSSITSSSAPSTSVTPGPTPDPFVYDEVKFEEERNEMLENLTLSQTQYDYVINKDPEFDYSTYKRTDKSNEFLSWGESVYKNINGQDVTTNFYYWPGNDQINHPNVAMGLLLYRAIKYKLAYPDKDNEVCITSYHISATAGINLVYNSKYYGTLKKMDDEPIDRDGYVRLTYLAAFAAMIGIEVHLVPEYGGYFDTDNEVVLDNYFLPLLDQPCSAKHGMDAHLIGEFLHYDRCKWISDGGKSAADMYHIKTLLAKHYLGDDGLVHDNTVYTSSANFDSVLDDGTVGMNISQTGLVVSNHEYLYRAFRNFIVFSSKYCAQDDVFEFRKDFKAEIKKQKAEIAENGYKFIKDEMMIYLGTPQDMVFEVQFMPFTEYLTSWTSENPYCKYVDKLRASEGAISFYFTNPKSGFNADFLQTFLYRTIGAFHVNRSQEEVNKSVFYAGSPIPESMFGEIVVGTHVGRKVINNKANHQKDILFEYEEAGLRYSTLMLTTSNYHAGSNFYQVNSCLLVKQIEGVNTGVSDTFKACYEQYELKVNQSI